MSTRGDYIAEDFATGFGLGNQAVAAGNRKKEALAQNEMQKAQLMAEIQHQQDAAAAAVASQDKDIAARQSLQQAQFGNENAMMDKRYGSESTQQKERLAGELQLQQALQERQLAVERERADRSGHGLADQFNAYHDTYDQLASGVQQAQQSGDPNQIASAQRRFQSWQQMGPQIAQKAQKNQGLNYEIDPETGAMKVKGNVSSPEELAAIKAQLSPAKSVEDDGIASQLDSAIAAKRKALAQNMVGNPTGGSTMWDTFGMGYKSEKANLEKELQVLQATRSGLGGGAPLPEAAPAAAAPSSAPGTISRAGMGEAGKSLKPGQVIFQGGKSYQVTE